MGKRVVSSVLATLLLASCSQPIHDHFDRQAEMSRDDFKELLIPETTAIEQKIEEPKIPEVADILAAPKEPELGENKLISLSVTEDVPLKDVLIEIGRMADINMEIDASIQGGIILRVKDKPFMSVIKRVADLGGLRYEVEDSVLRVEKDLPYVQNYKLDYLNLVRSNSGGLSISTQVLSASVGGEGGEGLSSGSTNEISATSDGDLWQAIQSGIESILQYTPSKLSVRLGESGNIIADNDTLQTSLNINKQAGIVTVLANKKQQENVAEYLEEIRRKATAQVLIEAKIVEVTLDDQYRSGINWGSTGGAISDFITAPKSGFGVVSAFDNLLQNSDGTPTETVQFSLLNADKNSLKAAISFTESFGTSRTLSSPRLNAMNNQQAVLTFAENSVYFTVEVSKETETDDNGNTTETVLADSTVNTVPIGMILALQPSIDLDAREVTMNIRPTLSRITESKDDPGVELQVAQIDKTLDISSQIPVIEVRELDSVLKLKDGQIMVMGGLMEERTINQDVGVPYVSRIPIFGNAFKGVSKVTEVVETVIFIKATIVDQPIIHDTDKRFYRKFTRDPRPLAF